MPSALSQAELLRYSRHLIIPGVGPDGQMKLKNASVLLIGTGGLGSPAALYLAAAGVGRLGLVDPDVVDASNLQRQILHGESWIGKPKLESAADRLREINPHITVEQHPVRFTPANARSIAESYDIILDGCDNFPTRFLTNDTAFFLKKPLVYGAIHRFEGQVSVFAPHLGGPCYRCLIPTSPAPGAVPSCNEAGVLGVLPGIIGSLQAMEAIKLILGLGEPPLGKLVIYDALSTSFRSIKLRRDTTCRLCGDHPSIFSTENAETTAPATCQVDDPNMQSITTSELRKRLNGDFDAVLIDVREPHEHAVANIPQAELIPLATLPDQIDRLPKDREIIVHCKSGGRSAKAVDFLIANGFENVTNVTGGMDAWLAES
ncbi:molybdopterin-synthase adenylyltransferase MoeB [Luteolibacter pohnpeiensis]|uniref:Molybdopterin-synthase adenylyltransferase n=1 Tax=Luteolibacter pohnpeiensis TaxID=454153 RepID=A0A934S8S1_9BACT|nr:molybdopterin-synthase adenylyltransferase MoeB [Luteolibacter pohnpeiensis]MBK1882931.1 molybdopterin-synthase adenylyltransferase MoeB [Luteolibacter pohnpeiensis]